MASIKNSLLRDLYVIEDENNVASSAADRIWPSTILDQVYDNLTPDNKTLRTILDELHEEIVSGGIGAINFPVTSVNGKDGDVVLSKHDIGLGNVDNTKDSEKPLSDIQRSSIMDILAGYNFNVDLSPLYDHMADMNNPHGVTFEQINRDGSFSELINEIVNAHDVNVSAHSDIRQLIELLTRQVDSISTDVDVQLNSNLSLIQKHLADDNAHSELFAEKEDIASKVSNFQSIDNITYPTTSAVAEYVADQLTNFREETVEETQRIIDIQVVGTRDELPYPDEQYFQHAYFILKGESNHDEFAVCRRDITGVGYTWDITVLSTYYNFNPLYFREDLDGLGLNVDLISEEVANNQRLLDTLIPTLREDVENLMGNYVTHEEFENTSFVSDIQIVPGTQSGTIRYSVNHQMSEDVKVADIKTLAFLDKVNHNNIEDNAVEGHHIAHRSIEHRHLQDQIVAAHNMRARYMHIFGNIEDKEGYRVSEIPITYFASYVEEAFYNWVQESKWMNWLKDNMKELVRQLIHELEGWTDPAAHVRIYIDGYDLMEQADGDAPHVYIDSNGYLILDDDDEKPLVQEIINSHYEIKYEDGCLWQSNEVIHGDIYDTSTSYGTVDEPQPGVEISGANTFYTMVTYKDVAIEKGTGTNGDAWYAKVGVTCPYAIDNHCCKYGDECDRCKVSCHWIGYSGATADYKIKDIANCPGGEGVGKVNFNFTLTGPEMLANPNSYDGMVQYTLEFDWDEDGDCDQTMRVRFDPSQIILRDGEEIIWPVQPPKMYANVDIEHDYCEKADSCAHECCRVTGSGTPHVNVNFDTARFKRGDEYYYPGINIHCPYASPDGLSCTKYGDPSQCHIHLTAHTPDGDQVVTIGESTCSEEDYGLISTVLPMNLEHMKAAYDRGEKVKFEFECDWNETGSSEQIIDVYIDPKTTVLINKYDQPDWPEDLSTHFGTVEIGHDYCDRTDCDHTCCTVEGSGTKYVSATINEAVYSSDTDTWYPGICIRCPYASADGLTCSKYTDPTQCTAKAYVLTPSQGKKEFTIYDGSCSVGKYGYLDLSTSIRMIDVSRAERDGKNVEFRAFLDWDEDGFYEQNIDVHIDPTKVRLNALDGRQRWP